MLSDRHQAVFDFIIGYKEINDGIPPSFQEIGDGCHIKAKSHVVLILNKLQNHGLIHFRPNLARSIQVVGGKWVYRNGDDDYQAFLDWYEENETWLEGCHTERQAFYAAWQAGAMGGESDG